MDAGSIPATSTTLWGVAGYFVFGLPVLEPLLRAEEAPSRCWGRGLLCLLGDSGCAGLAWLLYGLAAGQGLLPVVVARFFGPGLVEVDIGDSRGQGVADRGHWQTPELMDSLVGFGYLAVLEHSEPAFDL